MKNKRAEYTAGMESKIKDMATALAEVKAKYKELDDAKSAGTEAVAELNAKKVQLNAEMQLAIDLGEAELMLQQIEGIDRKIGLQMAINNGQATKFVGELDELFKSFFAIYAGAKNIYHVLDMEYVQTMSIRTAEEDVAKMDDFASKLNVPFYTAKTLLIDAGLADRSTVLFNGTHLGQMSLMTKGSKLKKEMANLQQQLSI